jgi:hypothetical protein
MMLPATEVGFAAAWSIDAGVIMFRHHCISIFNAGFMSV